MVLGNLELKDKLVFESFLWLPKPNIFNYFGGFPASMIERKSSKNLTFSEWKVNWKFNIYDVMKWLE